jgi:hypothetical protein
MPSKPTRRRVLLGLLALPFAPRSALQADALSAKWLAWCGAREFRVTSKPLG